MIRQLDADSVRHLCAGQVLSSIAGVVKELLENSLDAKATQVVVLLWGHGLDRISVCDDGEGFTLSTVRSGSVGAEEIMSRRVSSKRHKAAGGAQATVADQEALSSCGDVESSQGESLGFRGEALHSLAQLSEVAIDTKTEADAGGILLTHHVDTNVTTVQPSTATRAAQHGTTVTASNLFQRFPVRRRELERTRRKQLQDTVNLFKQYALSRPDVKLVLQHRASEDDATVTLVSTSGSGDLQRSLGEAYGGRVIGPMVCVHWSSLPHCDVSGYLSAVGGGRATTDMQVFSLDGRLVDLPKLAKTLQDTFVESHPNASQRTCPAFFLSFRTDGCAAYDVNLAPNKRRVLLQLEKEWITSIRNEALKIFQASKEVMDLTAAKNHNGNASAARDLKAKEIARSEQRRMAITLTPVSATSHAQVIVSSADHRLHSGGSERSPSSELPSASRKRERDASDDGPIPDDAQRQLLLDDQDVASSPPLSGAIQPLRHDEEITITDEGLINYHHLRRYARFDAKFPALSALPLSMVTEEPTVTPDADAEQKKTKGLKKKKSNQRISKSISAQSEDELNQLLHKADFPKMEIHGQFNHGFIVASLGDDLYIIDQHASDEKYNYEQLCAKYVARPQPLVRPIRVAMEADEAMLALEHAAELRAHGFIVQRVCDTASSVRSDEQQAACNAIAVAVASVPILPYDTVVPEDVCELSAQLLQYNAIVKPLKAVWHSMATKACRSSIMIGAVLNDKMMRSIVDHLGTLDQPWNCPHGRPTLRHLGSLATFREAVEHDPHDGKDW